MKNMPLISIGILNYNGLKYLKKTIPPILKLSYPNYEIVIVDNGSNDGSIEYLKQFKKIRLIENKENKGYGAGKNKIVNKTKGKYVLLIDNDILLIDKKILIKLLDFYICKKDISFLSFPLQEIKKLDTDHYGLYYTSRKKSKNCKKIMKLKEFIPAGFIGGAVFFNKRIWNKLGGYDEKYPFNLDDYDLSARSWLQNYKIYLHSKIKAIHLGTTNRTEKNSWCWKNSYHFCGFNRMMLKNYNTKNLFFWIPASNLWIFFKSINKSYQFRSFKPITSYFISIGYFLRDLPDTLKERRKIQSKRIIKEDIFLKIKPPKFD